MGLIHSGAPPELVLRLKRVLKLALFVETGTYRGDTTAFAAEHFEEVISIEADPALHAGAKARLRGLPNVTLLEGESQTLLPPLVDKIGTSAMFWLDGHWSGPGTAGEMMECPLLAEIAAIDHGLHQHVVLVDDARLFLNRDFIGQPHKVSHWPDASQVFEAMRRRFTDSYIAVHEDVILRGPRHAADDIERALKSV